MKLTLSTMSKDRRVGKALLRLRRDLTDLEQALAVVEVNDPRYESVTLWLTDNPPNFYSEEVDKSGSFVLIWVGIAEHLTFVAADDDELRRFWVSQVEFFISKADLSETCRTELLAACADWRARRNLV